jgi:hypothetical protein
VQVSAQAVACSADGSRIVTVGSLNFYRSTDFGKTWVSSPVPMLAASALASSADGTTLLSVYNGANAPVYTSRDSGATWVTNGAPVWYGSSVASSADGNFLAAIAGSIYLAKSAPYPLLNVARSAGDLTLSWAVPSMNFALQENFDLATTNWTNVMQAPVLIYSNLTYQVTVSAVGNRYYRLASP